MAELEVSPEQFWTLRDRIRQKLFAGLNPQQFKTVESGLGPVLCLAGAGSGKTTAMVNRVLHLLLFGPAYEEKDYMPLGVKAEDLTAMEFWLGQEGSAGKSSTLPERIRNLISYQGVDPRSILAITFTNKAAQEMKDRIAPMVGPAINKMWVMTFHAACLRILRQEIAVLGYDNNFVIYDTQDQLQVIKDALKQLDLDDKKYKPKSMSMFISKYKSELKAPDQIVISKGNVYEEKALRVYTLYQELLIKNNALDFDDLIMLTVILFQKHPEILDKYQERFRYIMVDEYQDTNHTQYMLIKLLAEKYRNICVVGDDDQSIYGFRQADIRNILEFEKDYPEAKVIKLEENYRSTQKILEAANKVISKNKGRKDKRLWTQNPEGHQLVQYLASDEKDEARFVAEQISKLLVVGAEFQDCAVLVRTNAQSRALEEWFIRTNIPYKLIGGTNFYERKEIKDILAYLKFLSNPSDSVSLLRIINVPRRGIGDATVQKLIAYSQQNNVTIGQVLDNLDDLNLGARAFKGLVDFRQLIEKFREMLGKATITELTETILKETGYLQELISEASYESQSRVENLHEFLTKTQEYDEIVPEPNLSEFLSQVSLVSDLDTFEENSGYVAIMTMHSAKGLEFKNVFLVGMEEGIFPHFRSFDEIGGLEEERRLCYVAITRAQERLYLIAAKQRNLYGQHNYNPPSRFLRDLPEELCEIHQNGEDFFQTVKEPRKLEARQASQNLNRIKSKLSPGGVAYSLGDKVIHDKWGEGVVVAVRGEAEEQELSIAFPGEGIKNLLTKYAPLVKG
ncbi:MAG: DNA helicase PcrA [Peptococcia bacterium]